MPWIIQKVYALAGGADCGWHGQEQHWEAGQVIQHMEGKSKPSILVLSFPPAVRKCTCTNT